MENISLLRKMKRVTLGTCLLILVIIGLYNLNYFIGKYRKDVERKVNTVDEVRKLSNASWKELNNGAGLNTYKLSSKTEDISLVLNCTTHPVALTIDALTTVKLLRNGKYYNIHSISIQGKLYKVPPVSDHVTFEQEELIEALEHADFISFETHRVKYDWNIKNDIPISDFCHFENFLRKNPVVPTNE